jgi:hypothetical protein
MISHPGICIPITIRDGYVSIRPAVLVRPSGNVRKFTAGAFSFGYFSLGRQRKVTRVQGAAPAYDFMYGL